MPVRDESRKAWRGQVKWGGKVYRHDCKTRKAAVEWEAAKKKELKAQGKHEETLPDLDLISFFTDYLDQAELRFVKRTFDEKKRLCHLFLEMFGNMSVHDVTPEMVHRYLQEQARNRSANSSNRDRKNLQAMWNWGRDVLGLESNPAARIKTLPHERSPQYVPPTEDVLRIMAAATPDERVFLNCYLQTGARRGEIFRWTWHEDINFERREIRLGTRKTKDGSMRYEWLPMNETLFNELQWWWKNRPIKDTPYIFVSTSKNPGRHYGKPYTERRWFMHSLCKRAGVKHFGFHALRRYVASSLADTHKVSAKTIQRILRHGNLATTERYIKNLNADLASTMDLLGQKGTQEGHPKNGKGLGNDS